MPSTPTTARLEARISPELHRLLKRAAEIQGRTLTDFVVTAVGPPWYQQSDRKPEFDPRTSLNPDIRQQGEEYCEACE